MFSTDSQGRELKTATKLLFSQGPSAFILSGGFHCSELLLLSDLY